MSTVSMRSGTTGSGEVIVLVPGGLTGWLSWEPHAKELSKKYKVVRVQLISVDLGLKNEPLPEGYSVDYETRALTRTLDENGIEEAHFAAWSYGGEITLNFALNNPERVKSLTLIEPAAKWVLGSRGHLPDGFLQERRTMQSLSPDNITESQLEWFAHVAGLVPPDIDPKDLPQWSVWMKHRQSLRMRDAPYRHEDNIERVRNFKKPVLLFKGEGSAEFDREVVDILGKEFPNARIKVLPGGHALHIVSMHDFMKILASFLDAN